jgi:hypothetical protein
MEHEMLALSLSWPHAARESDTPRTLKQIGKATRAEREGFNFAK